MPAVFAFADTVIGRPQTSIFAAFGSFAFLVLVEFGGLPRTRLLAYLGLAAIGAGLISIGTLCSRTAWLGAAAMAVVAFGTLFAGAFSGYLAAGANGAILAFVLPVNVPAPNSAIPDRLLGWALAAGVATTAAMFLWPPRRRADLRRAAAGTTRKVADLMEADPGEQPERARLAREAVNGLRRKSLGSQHRPAGPTTAIEPRGSEEIDAMAAAADLLRACADRLDGGDAQPDFSRLDEARTRVARALMGRLPRLAPAEDDAALLAALDPPFRIRAVTYAARQVGEYAMRATRGRLPATDDDVAAPVRQLRSAAAATERTALEHASTGSVWLQNSVRGAAALAVATYIAQRSDLQHGFWVVLGTLSVLRSNALGTGWSIVTALAGTAVGIVVGAVLVIGIGTHHAVLWVALPIAVLLAAYVRRGAGRLHRRSVRPLQPDSARRLARRRRPRRRRRDRVRDQSRRGPVVLAARRGGALTPRPRRCLLHERRLCRSDDTPADRTGRSGRDCTRSPGRGRSDPPPRRRVRAVPHRAVGISLERRRRRNSRQRRFSRTASR